MARFFPLLAIDRIFGKTDVIWKILLLGDFKKRNFKNNSKKVARVIILDYKGAQNIWKFDGHMFILNHSADLSFSENRILVKSVF